MKFLKKKALFINVLKNGKIKLMKKNKLIFVACDTSSIKQVKKILKNTKTNKLKIIPKFGYQFFYSKYGRKFLEQYKSHSSLI